MKKEIRWFKINWDKKEVDIYAFCPDKKDFTESYNTIKKNAQKSDVLVTGIYLKTEKIF